MPSPWTLVPTPGSQPKLWTPTMPLSSLAQVSNYSSHSTSPQCPATGIALSPVSRRFRAIQVSLCTTERFSFPAFRAIALVILVGHMWKVRLMPTSCHLFGGLRDSSIIGLHSILGSGVWRSIFFFLLLLITMSHLQLGLCMAPRELPKKCGYFQFDSHLYVWLIPIDQRW